MVELPPWCSNQDDYSVSELQQSALSFLKAINLPDVHPYCRQLANNVELLERFLNPKLKDEDYHVKFTVIEKVFNAFHLVVPALYAMGELWIRLFAGIFAPLCLVLLITFIIMKRKDDSGYRDTKNSLKESESQEEASYVTETQGTNNLSSRKMKPKGWTKYIPHISLLGVVSGAVVLTDAMYVQEHGRMWVLFCLLLVLGFKALNCSASENMISKVTVSRCKAGIVITTLITAAALFNDLVIQGMQKIDLPAIKAGYYYNSDNRLASAIAMDWSEEYRRYEPTPWLYTGDSRTGIPFLINPVPEVQYMRRWLKREDNEAVALDIAFPGGAHHRDKPVYLILHGLNGGSHEDYVREFVGRQLQNNSTVVVMVARGLMSTPVIGESLFHGARVSDVEASAAKLKAVTKRYKQLLAGVGYSMGGIILPNYVARSGKSCHLDAAVVVAGGLDMRPQGQFWRSIRLWQKILAAETRDILLREFSDRYMKRLTREQYLNLVRSHDINGVDIHGITNYNGFKDVNHYYTEMSAAGDYESTSSGSSGRLSKVNIPMLVIHALDDPLITWRTVGKPEDIIKSGSGNIQLLLTNAGGHVGWPVGLNPREEGWGWMNKAASSFVESVVSVS